VKRSYGFAPIAVLFAGCVDTGTNVHEVGLWVNGRADNRFEGRDGWSITLERADVAFGPLTLCSGTSAGEFCETARGEWVNAVVVDALDEDAQQVGSVIGTTGPVLSWMYDYGLVSVLTQTDLYETKAARELGGNSVQIAGCADKDDAAFCFTVAARIAQNVEVERGVPVVRVSGEPGPADLGQTKRLAFAFDPQTWLSGVDFEALWAAQSCETDCAPVVLDGETQAGRAVQIALAASARPELSWK
jgi:hypothetical protein